MRYFKRMPRAAEEAHRRAFENLAIGQRIHMRAHKAPAAKQPGIWQALLALFERMDEAKQIAEDAKATADKAASRPARAAAEKLIRRSE